MSAPVIWIVAPGVLAGGLYLARRWPRLMTSFGLGIAALLALLAWSLPIGESLSLGPLNALFDWRISSTLTVLGRRFVLDEASRPVLMLLYTGVTFWFGGAWVAGTDRLFIPLGLGIAALLVAALAVQPFLYAALLIEMAALLSVPILSPPGQPVGRGALRFLVFQTLGLPFILLTGWLLGGLEALPGNEVLLGRVILLLLLGFAMLAAVFPFHTWLPMVGEESHPYAAAFVQFVFPTAISLLGLGFLQRFPLAVSLPLTLLALRSLGALMVLLGGVWAAFSRHLGRTLGFAAMMEVGLGLLALSLSGDPQLAAGEATGLPLTIFFALILPRGLSLGVWAVALAILRAARGELRFRAVQGVVFEYPLATTGLLLGMFSLGGLPLLAGFPVRLALWSALAQRSLPVTLLALLGSAGLLTAAIRTLAVVIVGPDRPSWRLGETRWQRVLLGIGGLLLLIFGLAPQWFLGSLAGLGGVFGGGGL